MILTKKQSKLSLLLLIYTFGAFLHKNENSKEILRFEVAGSRKLIPEKCAMDLFAKIRTR